MFSNLLDGEIDKITPGLHNASMTGPEFLFFGPFEIDILLGCISFLSLLKWLLMFRMTKSFGPMFKIIENMLKDLMQFMIIMGLILLMFSCISIVAFGDDSNF